MVRPHLLVVSVVLGCGPGTVLEGGDEVASETGTGTDTETETDTGDASDTGVPEDCSDAAPGAEIVACTESHAYGFLLADEWIYFSQPDRIERVRPDGSEREVVVDGVGDLRELEIVDDTLHWVEFDQGLVRARPLAGGDIEDLGEVLFKPVSFAIHDAQLYVSQYEAGADILRVPLDGGASAVFETLVDYGNDLAIVGTDLYWVTNSNNGNISNDVTQAPLAGGEPVVISSALLMTSGLVADATHLYWTRSGADHPGEAFRWPLAGGQVETLASLFGQVGGISLDADALYWTIVDAMPNNDGHSGEVWRVAKAGGNAELLIGGQHYAQAVLVDETHVQWVNQQAIARLPLP